MMFSQSLLATALPTPVAHPLDNPIWNALSTRQLWLAEGNEQARRFPADIGFFAGLPTPTESNYAALRELVGPGDDEVVILFLEEQRDVPADWRLLKITPLFQMVLENGLPPGISAASSGVTIEELTAADIPDMLALTQLTQPGPFLARTQEVGSYLGIRQNGRLAAMAGERFQLDGYTEISAVCTHPDFQGKGYARMLVAAVSELILSRGNTPFLHVLEENVSATRVYEKLGFQTRRRLYPHILQPAR